VGDEVAIVTNLPGTTRDVLRQQVHFDGLPVNLIDTAGLRMAADVVEEEGIRRARFEMQRADRVLYVLDATLGQPNPAADLTHLPPAVPVVFVMNKIDLLGSPPRLESNAGFTRVYLSAQTGAGIELLQDHLKASAAIETQIPAPVGPPPAPRCAASRQGIGGERCGHPAPSPRHRAIRRRSQACAAQFERNHR